MTAPILVTGSTGQLGVALAEAAAALGLVLDRVDRPAFDFDRPGSIAQVFAASAPALVVNTAAYTAVDAAEDDADAAFRANRDGPAELARLCEAAGIPLIHISTDYVFDGPRARPMSRPTPRRRRASMARASLPARLPCWRGARARSWCGHRGCIPRPARTSCAPCWPPGSATGSCGSSRTRRDVRRARRIWHEAILAMAARLMGGGWEDRCAGVYHAAGTGGRPGTSWRPRRSKWRRAMARRCRRWCRSRRPSGRPGRSGRRTRGSTAAGSRRCSGCACRRGGTDWRGPSRRSSPGGQGETGRCAIARGILRPAVVASQAKHSQPVLPCDGDSRVVSRTGTPRVPGRAGAGSCPHWRGRGTVVVPHCAWGIV